MGEEQDNSRTRNGSANLVLTDVTRAVRFILTSCFQDSFLVGLEYIKNLVSAKGKSLSRYS